MPYNIWCDGCKNHIGMGELRKNIFFSSQYFSHLHNPINLFVQGFVTMLRRRKWGTTTPHQSTGKQTTTTSSVKMITFMLF